MQVTDGFPQFYRRRFWMHRGRGALPEGAIAFQLGRWSSPFAHWQRVQAAELMDRFEAERLILFHGNAVERDNRAVLLLGPPGIGKSTVCARLARRGLVRVVEDGLGVLAIRAGRWELLETGTAAFLTSCGRFARWLRRCVPRSGQAEGRRGGLARAVHRRIDVVAYWLAVLTAHGGGTHKPRLLELQAIRHLSQAAGPHATVCLGRGAEPMPLIDLALAVPDGVDYGTLATGVSRQEMERMLLSACMSGVRSPEAQGDASRRARLAC